MSGSLYEPFDFCFVRAPLLPVETYECLGASPSPEPPTATFVPWALQVASQSLSSALVRSPADSREQARIHDRVLRYRIRMATRPTPFGLFAGVGIARWGQHTGLRLGHLPRARIRPDMGWLLRLVTHLEEVPEIRKCLRLVANPAVFERDGRVFLAERAPRGSQRTEPAVSVRATEPVRQALWLARAPMPHAELTARLGQRFVDVSGHMIETLVDQLWEQSLLFTDLWPPLTSADPARWVVDRLAVVPAAETVYRQLASLLHDLTAANSLSPPAATDTYQRAVEEALALENSTPDPPLQVDMAHAVVDDRISRRVGREVARAAELLIRLNPAPGGPPYLTAYRRAFETRYGRDRDVPLLELLDPRFGLGSPFSYGKNQSGSSSRKMRERQRALLDLACGALRDGLSTVALDSEMLARLEVSAPAPFDVPVSLDVYAFVVTSSAAAVDAGDFLIVLGPAVGTSGAGKALGRFADFLGPEAEAALRDIARAEQDHRPQAVMAELVYRPRRFRSANVAIRPAVRDYEMAVGVSPGVGADNVIPLNELAVRVTNSRLALRWIRRDVEVVIGAGHMLNPQSGSVACRFLSDLGRNGLTQLTGFDWGPAAAFPFLPRVQVGRVVLAPAQWRVHARAAGGLPTSSTSFTESLNQWRSRWSVPRHVYLTTGDNRLMLDLDRPEEAEQLRHALVRVAKSTTPVRLQEALPSPSDAWVEGPGGRFMSELVVPLALRAQPGNKAIVSTGRPSASLVPPSPRHRIDVLRPPGSDWLFLKLYVPQDQQDQVLADDVAPMTEGVIESGLVKHWFFIRYSDPQPHLRLRFYADPNGVKGRLVPLLCDWATQLMDEGICARFCFDTYERELERYGGVKGTDAAEALFAADSEAVVGLLRLLKDGELQLDRMSAVVLSVDDILASLGIGVVEVLRAYDQGALRRESGPAYRHYKERMRRLLADPGLLSERPAGKAALELLARRRAAIVPVAERLRALAEAALSPPLAVLARSFVHLHCNRFLGTDPAKERLALALAYRVRHGLTVSPYSAR